MRRRFTVCFCLGAALFPACGASAQSIADLQQMSISELQDVDVMSVTRTSEPLSDAPGAIYVITRDAIIRSGLSTIPEILRLAPNLQVKQITASRYIITARGFSGNISDQNFSNKLLVLIDGRSVYTPLYSGVYWDMQDVIPADIERIEVISGPGATLWGANAVNGVINIITRKSADTQGGLLDISAGNLEQSVSLRYGGHLADDLAYRVYVRDYIGEDTETAGSGAAHDNWSKPQGGFRFDWTPSDTDSVTVQGDAYSGADAQPGAPDEDISGRNLQAHWTHGLADGSSLQVLAYYDRTSRGSPGNGEFWLDTYNIDVQHSFALNDWNAITWGGGLRISNYTIAGTASLFFAPASRTLNLANGFVQDSITLSPSLSAILGLKLEADPYSGVTPLPSGRLSWKVDEDTLLWASVSYAIRSPTPFDRDVQERLGTAVTLNGDPQFISEKLTAYEIGTRVQLNARLSGSISAFYNAYDDLRTIELVSGPATLNLSWGNGLAGHTLGFEAWGDYQLTPWWRLSASFEELAEHFNFTPGASGLIGASQLGDDPEQSAALRSSVNLGDSVTLAADLRYVGPLPDPHVPAYVEFNTSIGWNVSDDVRLSLSGFNLLHARHQEFPASEANAVPRSFSVGLQWRF
jgi:iron complex outermembrane receptor protein